MKYTLLLLSAFVSLSSGNLFGSRIKDRIFGQPSTKKPLEARISDGTGNLVQWGGMSITTGPLAVAHNAQQMKDLFGDSMDRIHPVSDKAREEFEKLAQSAVNDEDARLNGSELIQKYEYPFEQHYAQTEDGYILTLFRMPPRRRSLMSKAPVVFLMHGLLDSADDWVIMGPKKSLAYILHDAGYDVWMGNARGNKYSRQHVNKHPIQAEFWQYSWDEVGNFDLPAMIDYTLATTKQNRLYYVGHSQGTTSFFVMASLRPEYNEKIKLMFALAPVAWMTHVVSPFVRLLSPASNTYHKILENIGVNEFLPNNVVLQAAGGFICQNKAIVKSVCSNAMFIMYGYNLAQLNASKVPAIVAHVPAGSSTRQMVHYGQGLVSHDFRRFDFGMDVNHKVYGSRTPPSYNVSAITAPIALYYSENDWLSHPKDVKTLRGQLPHVLDFYLVPDDRFNHMDYLWAMNAPNIIYSRILATMEKFY